MEHLLDHFDKSWSFVMPDAIRKESESYLKENDSVAKFVEDFVVADADGYFTLKDAKTLFKQQEYYNGRIKMLKTDLEKALRAPCHEQKRVRGVSSPCKNVFIGFSLNAVGASATTDGMASD